jgi:thiosulfate dehydrogenase [quinone] large subunit
MNISYKLKLCPQKPARTQSPKPIGWTYFSAFWRRVALENKLDPETAGYIGEKFNAFLPNALGIKPIIKYLVENPDALWINMVIFTIVEGIVGLAIMFGLFTRIMSIGVFGLAMGILLGSGWIGTTCLDEWQIGILGIATGFVLFLTGSGKYSLDNYLMKNNFSFYPNYR